MQKAWFTFAAEMDLKDLPPDGDELVLYASWLICSGHCSSPGSLRQYLSSVRTLCRDQGLYCPSPAEYGPLLNTVVGMGRRFPGPVRRSLPVTAEILRNLVHTLPPPTPSWYLSTILSVFVDTSILLYFTMLRSSNLFPPHPGAADPMRQLTWDRVRNIDTGVVLTVILAKTLQYRERVHQVCLAALPGSPFCPVAALNRLADVRGRHTIMESDLVIQIPSEATGWKPMVKYQYLAWFKARLAQMGLPSHRYHIHGWRHGSVAAALALVENTSLVRVASDHISDALFTYSNIDPVHRMEVTRKMLADIDSPGSQRV